MIDPLTQINARDEIVKAIRSINIGHLILLDIDNFNSINNLYGMQSGDKILIELAKYLDDFSKREGYEVYRIGSNEFGLLDIDATHDIEDIFTHIEYLIEGVSKHEIYLDAIHENINIDITIGFATANQSILEQAGTALKYAKQNHLKFSAYSNITNNEVGISQYIYWNKEIQKAIEANNIVPFFQPIYDNRGDINKYEVLMRLVQEDEDKKIFISPVQFLNISVQTKKYDAISKTIIFHALQMSKNGDYNFSINLSYQDISNKDLMYDIYRFFEENPQTASKITFEILESEMIKDTKLLLNFLSKVKSFGAKIAIDDFGSGFSNIEMILLIKPDFLKIDGSLIKKVDVDKEALTLVEAIVAFSHKMGMEVIAEYVHSEVVYNILQDIDVDLFQGYYLCEPLCCVIENSH